MRVSVAVVLAALLIAVGAVSGCYPSGPTQPETQEKAQPQTPTETAPPEQPAPEQPAPEQPAPEQPAAPMGAESSAPPSPGEKAPAVYVAELEGAQEVPPVETKASGKAVFELTEDGKGLGYEIVVENIENVDMAHLHIGAEGENGDHVAWLYPASGPPPKTIEGVFTGTLAEGTLTATGFVGPLEGKTMADLVDKINDGQVYVNVHTKQHPDGEIRGQLSAQLDDDEV